MNVSCECGRQYQDIKVLPLHCICGIKNNAGFVGKPSMLNIRHKACRDCEHNSEGICLKFKSIHPDRPCVISIGVSMPGAKCPMGKWDDKPKE